MPSKPVTRSRKSFGGIRSFHRRRSCGHFVRFPAFQDSPTIERSQAKYRFIEHLGVMNSPSPRSLRLHSAGMRGHLATTLTAIQRRTIARPFGHIKTTMRLVVPATYGSWRAPMYNRRSLRVPFSTTKLADRDLLHDSGKKQSVQSATLGFKTSRATKASFSSIR
jgi:hypothetical protein